MKILLVEDDRATHIMLKNVLNEQQYSVEIATDGSSALDLAAQFEYDLVLLDVGIPELDGISVCRQLRIQGSQIPILLLTARDGTNDRIVGLDAGADDYMVKPFHLPELMARIRALLRRSKTATASIVKWENLQLDYAVNQICYDGQVLRLTPKEYGILELFLLNPHRTFSRAALIDRLWDFDEPPTESAISSHIKAIRQKLRVAGARHDLIKTIYGFGYRLHSPETDISPALDPFGDREDFDRTDPTFRSEEVAAETFMLELWQQFKDSFHTQIDLLDQAIAALEQGNLTADFRQEVRQTAHKLVGSFGIYGFPHTSILARQIEDLFSPDIYLASSEVKQIGQLVADMKQELKQEPLFANSQFEQQRQVTELSERIKRSVNLQDILQTTVNEVRQFLQVDRSIVLQFSSDWNGKVLVESVGAEWESILSTQIFDPCVATIFVKSFKQCQVIAKSDIHNFGVSPCYTELFAKFQVKANLVVPILDGEELWGLLIAHSCSTRREWKTLEAEFVRHLASQVSIAIEQAGLFEQVQTELGQRRQSELTLQQTNLELEQCVTEHTAELRQVNNRLLEALSDQQQTQLILLEQAQMLNLAHDAIITYDLNHTITFWNDGARLMYGWEKADALGKNIHTLLQPQFPKSLAEINAEFQSQGYWHGESIHTRRDGRKMIVDSQWVMQKDEIGRPIKVLEINNTLEKIEGFDRELAIKEFSFKEST